MKTKFQKYPIYLFLLIFFFVFHGYTEHFNFIPLIEAAILFAVYTLSASIIFLIFRIVYGSWSKSALITFVLFSFFLFFGYFHDILLEFAPNHTISRHRSILIVGLIITFTTFIYLFFRKKTLNTFNYVTGVFISLLILTDIVWLTQKAISHKSNSLLLHSKVPEICDTCKNPDIYLIVPDLYAGESELLDLMKFDNRQFINDLEKRGFRYINNSSSNYNYTPFSIASMLNMEYLNIENGKNSDHNDLSLCYDYINNNYVTKFLIKRGYQFKNCSLFDINNEPSPVKKTILPQKTKFITAQTLFDRLNNDSRLNLAQFLGNASQTKRLYTILHMNERIIKYADNSIQKKTQNPKFVYIHLAMPHNPYYFDKYGQPNPDSLLRDDQSSNLTAYINYLQYTNNRLLNLIDTIKGDSSRLPIIVLISDHGFREFKNPQEIPLHYFYSNISAIYMPDANYQFFNDSMTNVNIFRTLFNTQFKQQFPTLPDSVIYIKP